MLFRIADSFIDSLARLTGDEQKAAKLAAFELQMNPARPGLKFHRIDKARDPNFWSVRVSRDIRIVVHRREQSLLLCYVNHHDDAYRWAERRRLETHPSTGAAQLVEVRETVEDVVLTRHATTELAAETKPALFATTPESELLGYGIPEEWLGEVRAATEDTVLDVADHLPAEAAEALLTLAVGGTPQARAAAHVPPAASDVLVRSEAPRASAETRAFEHPDAQRRFRVIADREELERALEFPWEKWTVFLHPAQRELVERDYNGPARVFGSAGTGKTIVALHRAVYLARQDPDARILLATFSDPLARALRIKLRRLIGIQPRLAERIQVDTLDQVALRLFSPERAGVVLATPQTIRELIEEAAAAATPGRVSPRFLVAEWEQVVDAWQLTAWEAYRDVLRLGRRTRLPEAQRAALWAVFDVVWTEVDPKNWTAL